MADKINERKLTPREEEMERIGRSRNEEFKNETGIEIVQTPATVDPDIDPEHAAAEEERKRLEALAKGGEGDDDATQLALQKEQQDRTDADAEAARIAAEAATQRAQTSSLAPDAKITIKVNGKDMELTGEEAMRRLQKDVAGDSKLEEANRVMREAQALQQSVQEQQRIAAEADEAKTKGGNPDGVVVNDEVVKKFTAALFKGDAETATQAFNEAVSSAVTAATKDLKGRGQAATPVDPSAIAAQVRQQIAIDSALDSSKKDYPDLYADPDIEAVAASKIERMVKEGKPFITALDEVQTSMATKFGWKKAAQQRTPSPAATDRRSEKQARKEGLDDITPASSAKSATQEEPVQSVSDTIREMAKARGQTSVM